MHVTDGETEAQPWEVTFLKVMPDERGKLTLRSSIRLQSPALAMRHNCL
jgi:hypothetical protein